jgi:glycosyltransferase involved in cell wall biosynthesis
MTTFAIITVTYNAAATIADCLASVNAQSVPVEQIIIDGDSSDGTLDIVREISPHARIFSEPDKGIYDAMNKGIGLASGDVIAILNADDFYADEKVLERVAKAFEDPCVEACYGDLVYVKTGSKFGVRGSERRTSKGFTVVRYWKTMPYHPDRFHWGWMPPHPTFFVRRSVYERYGLFNLNLGSAADYELMLRFLLKYGIKVAYIPEVLVRMRIGGASNSSLRNRLAANRMDRKAWEVNGLKPHPWTLLMKPLRKIPQWWQRPLKGSFKGSFEF